MALTGTWKVDRNENYDKFMEQMGEWEALVWSGLIAWFVREEFRTMFLDAGVYAETFMVQQLKWDLIMDVNLGKVTQSRLSSLLNVKALTWWNARWPSTTTWRSPSSRMETSSTSRSPALSAPRTMTSPWASRLNTPWLMALKWR